MIDYYSSLSLENFNLLQLMLYDDQLQMPFRVFRYGAKGKFVNN